LAGAGGQAGLDDRQDPVAAAPERLVCLARDAARGGTGVRAALPPTQAGPAGRDNRGMTNGPKMVFLGFGKYVRADRIYALEPLLGDERGGGRRTRVWIEGIPDPIVASRTERSILRAMGQGAAMESRQLDEAIDLAERLVEQAESGR